MNSKTKIRKIDLTEYLDSYRKRGAKTVMVTAEMWAGSNLPDFGLRWEKADGWIRIWL